MSSMEDLGDPRFILFCIYGLFILVIALCVCLKLICGERPFRLEANEEESIESDGIVYELISSKRKKKLDSLRAGYLLSILSDFTLTLQNEHTIRRGGSTEKSRIGDAIEKDLEQGFESEEIGSTNNERNTESNKERFKDKPDDNENSTKPKIETTEETSTGSETSSEPEELPVEEYTHIAIPCSGVDIDGKIVDSCDDANKKLSCKKREVPIFCIICLSEYKIGDSVCWSSNSSCTHVFHRNCIVDWLVALGRRKSTMQHFSATPNETKLLNYEMECPCCRQEFVISNRNKLEA